MPGALSSSAQMMNCSAMAKHTSFRLTRRQLLLNGSASATNTTIPIRACSTDILETFLVVVGRAR